MFFTLGKVSVFTEVCAVFTSILSFLLENTSQNIKPKKTDAVKKTIITDFLKLKFLDNFPLFLLYSFHFSSNSVISKCSSIYKSYTNSSHFYNFIAKS